MRSGASASAARRGASPGAPAYVFPNLVPSIRNWPGLRYAFGPDSLAMKLRIPYFSAGYFSLFTRKHRDFEQFDSDIVSSVRGTHLRYL